MSAEAFAQHVAALAAAELRNMTDTLRDFMVFARYTDGQPYVTTVQAFSPQQAADDVVAERRSEGLDVTVEHVGVGALVLVL